jgi:UDP-N-acetylglucosamine acyltransferase
LSLRYRMPIHPTAIVSSKAELDPSVSVGPFAIIEDHVRIAAGTTVGPHAYLAGHTEIGRDNEIHVGAVIGHVPQDRKFDKSCRSYLRIGDRNIFREYSNVHRGTEPETYTTIGSDNLVMGMAHIGHNCVIGSNVVICNCALVAGHAHVHDKAFISGGVLVHQFVHVGRMVMMSGGARISLDAPPFMIIAERNELHALNIVGLKRAGTSAEAMKELKELYRLFFRSGLNLSQAIKEADDNKGFSTPEALEFLDFVRQSPNGICRPPESQPVSS